MCQALHWSKVFLYFPSTTLTVCTFWITLLTTSWCSIWMLRRVHFKSFLFHPQKNLLCLLSNLPIWPIILEWSIRSRMLQLAQQIKISSSKSIRQVSTIPPKQPKKHKIWTQQPLSSPKRTLSAKTNLMPRPTQPT
jgi:hypothetical protein